MRHLEQNIRSAFVLGYEGFLDFYHHQEDSCNKIQEFNVFDCTAVTYHLEFNDALAFLCVLYRLQQLPAQAVLARFHGIISRLCRRDLLLLSSILQLHTTSERHREERAAHMQEAPATDVLDAFGQQEPHVRDLMNSLTPEERSSIMTCVASLVDSYVSCFSQGVFLRVTFPERDDGVDDEDNADA